MRRMGLLAAVLPAVLGCTSTRMLQREGCWVKQTERWPSRVSEELGFCTKPAPVWAQDRVARLVQECMAQADFRWQNRAIAAWTRGDPIPPQESDDKIAQTCMNEASAALREAAKKPAPAAVATATSTGTAKTESDLRTSDQPPVQSAPATVVEVHGAPAQPAPVLVTPRTVIKPSEGCAQARKPAV